MKKNRPKVEKCIDKQKNFAYHKNRPAVDYGGQIMRKGEKRKQELIRIAYDMFLSRGYENTSVDEIIAEAQITKGTYYYYFPSKEKMLEDVIEMMIESEVETARSIIGSDIPVPQKIVAIITSMKPAETEQPIQNALMQPENVLMHDKIRKKLIEVVAPLLSEIVEEGINKGIFACDNIPERVRMLLVISNDTFNDRAFTENDITVFIDMTEKLLGANKGTMSFIYDLIDKSAMEDQK